MERDDYADMFRWRIGQLVRWAEVPDQRFRIHQRRWTQREILEPVVSYRLQSWHGEHATSRTDFGWVREVDLDASVEP